MLTNNYYNWLQAKYGASVANNSFKRTTGAEDGGMYFSRTDGMIIVGSGDTQPTRYDYALTEPIDSLTLLSTTREPTNAQNFDNSSMGQRISTSYRNDTNEAITVKEVSVVGIGTSSSIRYLVTRDIITPVTIYPGETYTFTVTIGG